MLTRDNTLPHSADALAGYESPALTTELWPLSVFQQRIRSGEG